MLQRQLNFEGVPMTVSFKVFHEGQDIDQIPSDSEVCINVEVYSVYRTGSRRDLIDELGYHIVKKIEAGILIAFKKEHNNG